MTHDQSKGVGKKPNFRRKGPSTYNRPEIDCYVDPLAHSSDICSSSPITMSCNSPSSVTSVNHSSPVVHQPLVSANQIMQMNYVPQSVTSSFHSSPIVLPSVQSSTGTSSSPILSYHGQFQVKFLISSIKICAGCRGGYQRAQDGKSSLPPPSLVHK